jgi:hypothetical protein
MKTVLAAMMLMTLTTLAACTNSTPRKTGLGDRDPWLRIDDLGGSAPYAPPGGPLVIVWKDNIAAVSAAFPATSASFRLIPVDAKALQTSLDSFLDVIPSDRGFALGEWTARVTVGRDDTPKGMISQDLSMCFVDARCPEVLGPSALAAWKSIVQQLQESKEQVDNAIAQRRADELWKEGLSPLR